MKKTIIAILLASVALLAACNNDSKEPQVEEQDGIGFNVEDETIEEAANVPEDEKIAILSAFDTYISTFNEKDLEAYMSMIAEDTESFDKEEERAYVAEAFELYDLIREPSDVTIVKYSEEEAQVFANLQNKLKQLSSGLETKESSRQVTVFVKEQDEWKVKSVHSIGENPTK